MGVLLGKGRKGKSPDITTITKGRDWREGKSPRTGLRNERTAFCSSGFFWSALEVYSKAFLMSVVSPSEANVRKVESEHMHTYPGGGGGGRGGEGGEGREERGGEVRGGEGRGGEEKEEEEERMGRGGRRGGGEKEEGRREEGRRRREQSSPQAYYMYISCS